MKSLYLLYLDRHHLGDDLFLKSLAQHFAEAGPQAPPCVLVHGSGEKVERTLEAQGYFPDRSGGVLEVETEEQRRLVERAVREVNQDIVATLTDEVVSTVGIQGVDRGLLRKASGGPLQASNTGWLSALLKQHVVPVVSALVAAPDTGTVQEVPAVEVVRALSDGLRASFDPVACVFPAGDATGAMDETGPMSVGDSRVEDVVADPAAVRTLVGEGAVLVAGAQELLGGTAVDGVWVEPE
jgi:isopentenyl phosphate kinase